MGIPIVAGRGFERTDKTRRKGKVAIVNETLAKRIVEGQNPIGRRCASGLSSAASDSIWHTVIGVAKDVSSAGWSAGRTDFMFP